MPITNDDLLLLEVEYEEAKAAAAQVHSDHNTAYRAAWDAHNAAVQALNVQYETDARTAQQAETAANTALLQARIAFAAQQAPEPEEDEGVEAGE
nr:hypothetical protein [uncultured Brevundimonas sp.]